MLIGSRYRPAIFRRLSVRAAALAGCAVGAGAGAASAARSEPAPVKGGGVYIVNSSFDVKFIHTANCSITRSGFTAQARRYGASLVVHIEPFSGFHDYVLQRASLTGPYVSTFIDFTTPSGVDYASNFVPPFPIPNFGAIRFTSNGKLIGLGMNPMFDGSGDSSVIVAGGMGCHYPSRDRRHRKH